MRDVNTPDEDLYADADIIKVNEVKNGYEIKLTGEDSKHCDDYVWQYKWYVGYVCGEIYDLQKRLNISVSICLYTLSPFLYICINRYIKDFVHFLV